LVWIQKIGVVAADDGGEQRWREILHRRVVVAASHGVTARPLTSAGSPDRKDYMEATSAHPAPLKVLVVDDERSIADTLRIVLNKSGFEALAVYGGEEAVEAARQWPPDIFLTDVVMPVMNGIEAAIEVGEMLPDCKILLFSGQTVTSDLLLDARARGYNFEILAKPVHPTELLSRLRDL
jgi:CheY-like chemotaxis protein